MQQTHAQTLSPGSTGKTLSGQGGPFRWTPQEPHELPACVRGALPEWLRGKLVRTSPAVFERGAYAAEHWFDGHGLVYAFELGPDGTVRYRQHLLESRVLAESEAGRAQIGTFDTRMQRGLWERLRAPIPPITDNTNVNVIPWQGQWLAMTEGPHQHVIDGDSLRTRGLFEYEDQLSAQMSMSAHPHFDRTRDALVNVGTSFGSKNELTVYRQKWSSHKREVEGKLALKRVPYLHSFGLTPQHALLIEHPYTVHPLRMLFSNAGYIEHFRWQPERGTRIWKLDRANGRFSAYETDSFFCFHTVNAFEDAGEAVFDLLAYDTPEVVQALRCDRLTRGVPDLMPRLVRMRLPPGGKRARLEQLSSARFEFPQIAYRHHSGLPYGHVWGASLASDARKTWASEIMHVELASDRVQRFSEPDMVLGEPVFVQRPGSTGEADGVLLTVGSHNATLRSELLVLDADRLELLARCEVEAAIPLGFHGNFAFEI